ncbi:MAG: MOSC domain-containing protein [Nitrospirae bacterium]|nr:MOSC domain-containing protein [Nitrospirota bacterium]MBF0541645.1 MOSC domain-containing protein [Nitrospirota bacterium]
MDAIVISVNISAKKGIRKKAVPEAKVIENFGIEGDAHASSQWHRQVSLLAIESIEKMKAKGLNVDCGDFAENLTTKGIILPDLPIGTRLMIGSIEAEVTQIGKECHTRCAIYHQAGDCVMPNEGIFVKVLNSGVFKPGDIIKVL